MNNSTGITMREHENSLFFTMLNGLDKINSNTLSVFMCFFIPFVFVRVSRPSFIFNKHASVSCHLLS